MPWQRTRPSTTRHQSRPERDPEESEYQSPETRDYKPIKMLEQVSEEDLLETDLYVFRESTGELVVEKLNFARHGDLTETPRNGVDEQGSQGYFELTEPGRDAGHSFRSVYRNRKLYNDYEDWQASLGIQASLQGYESDSLRVGEPLTLVVLNRATGYIGTASTSVVDVSERSINISLPDIRLFPPNLQVQVDRQYQVEKGLTAGESRHYRVGSEGAALTSDQFVSIHTQWLNHDGTALPSELPGYTGRLANLVGEGELNSSTVNQFSIDPGKHTEVLQLPNPALSSTAAHQYLHVVGREKHAMPESPDFGAGDDSEFPSRPTRFVPVKVAIYDEEASAELHKTQEALELEGVKQDSSVYRWVYRPEMQYSVFELGTENIQAIDIDEGDDESVRELTDSDTPLIAGDDDALRIKQSLLGSEYDGLSLFASEESLLLSLEDYEQSIETLRNGEASEPWSFNDLDHLGQLGAEDFLSLNQLKNNDAGNVLWEWAFDYLYIQTTDDSELNEFGYDRYYVFADDPVVNLSAGTAGYEYNSEGERRTVGIRWMVDGDGSMENGRTIEEGKTGYRNTLTMSTVAGSKATVTASIERNSASKASFDEVVELPGEPGRLSVNTSGSVGLDGTSSMTLTANVRDRHGNIVPDNTAVGFSLLGHGRLSETLAYTVDGVASAAVTGGFSKGDGGTVVVDINDITRTVNFEVASPRVSVTGVLAATRAGQRHELVVQVSGPGGSPAGNVFVSSTVDAGALSYVAGQHQTDSAGRLRFNWHTGHVAVKDAALTFRVGNEQLFEQQISVGAATVSTPPLTTQTGSTIGSDNLLVVGDRESAGNIPVAGVKSTTQNEFAYQIEDVINIANTQLAVGSAVRTTVALGSLRQPNRSPIMALDGSGLRRFGFKDTTGLVDLDAVGVTRVSNGPGAGTQAYAFNPDESSLLDTTLSPANEAQLGQMWIYPRAGGGSLARLGSSLSLDIEAERRVQLSVSLLIDGEIQQVQVSSDPIALNQWHFVAYQLEYDRLTLQVDDKTIETVISANTVYQSHSHELEFGRGYDGLITMMRWHTMDSAPLVTFDNGQEQIQVDVTGISTTELAMRGTNSLNMGRSGTLAAHKVDLLLDGNAVGSTIQVLPAAEVVRTASVLIDTIPPALDWDAFKSLYRQGD